MQSMHRLVDNHSVKHHNKLAKITAPLNLHFGISYFAYQRVYDSGYAIMLTNTPEWASYSIDQQYYLIDPTLVSPEYYASGYSYVNSHNHGKFQACLVADAINKFDLNHAFSIVERQPGYCDYYFLGAPTMHQHVYHAYHHHFQSLRDDFSAYFKTEMQDVIQQAHDDAIDVATIKAELYYSDKNILSLVQDSDVNINFLRDINGLDAALTDREQQCLELYRMGYTARETAKILKLSPRTIEEYLHRVKQKKGCRYKRDLLKPGHAFSMCE